MENILTPAKIAQLPAAALLDVPSYVSSREIHILIDAHQALPDQEVSPSVGEMISGSFYSGFNATFTSIPARLDTKENFFCGLTIKLDPETSGYSTYAQIATRKGREEYAVIDCQDLRSLFALTTRLAKELGVAYIPNEEIPGLPTTS